MITAKSQPFTPAYPWGTRTGTAARATAYRTKMRFVKDNFTLKTQYLLSHDIDDIQYRFTHKAEGSTL